VSKLICYCGIKRLVIADLFQETIVINHRFLAENNKVYSCTGAKKDVYKQLVSNPKASFCVENKFAPVLSVNGEVSILDISALLTPDFSASS
jgi:hypothetical protein